MKRPAVIIFLTAQVILLGIEQVTSYDTIGRQNALTITNLMALVGVLFLERWLNRRHNRLSALTIFFIAAAVWLDALGNFQHWYAEYWWYDRLSHAVGGLAASALFIDWLLIRQRANKLAASPVVALWLGFFTGQFVAAMYEVSEWLGDWWFNTHRVQGPYDSPRDLFFNLIGGLLVTGIFWLNRNKK